MSVLTRLARLASSRPRRVHCPGSPDRRNHRPRPAGPEPDGPARSLELVGAGSAPSPLRAHGAQRDMNARTDNAKPPYPNERRAEMNTPPTVSPQQWEAAREGLRLKEKELMRARDSLAAQRRRMPRMAVEKDYRFEGPDGPASLPDIFAGRRQLLLYRAFYEPRRGRLARACLRGLLVHGRPRPEPGASQRPRHDARVRLPRATGRHRPPEGPDGLGAHPVVHDHRRLRRRLRRRRVARPQRLHPRRATGSFAPTSATAAATR